VDALSTGFLHPTSGVARRHAHCFCVTLAGRRVAAWKRLAVAIVAVAMGLSSAHAESAPNLVLPLVTAIAFASAASKVPQWVGTLEPGGRPLTSLIPSRIEFDEPYGLDPEDLIGRRRPAAVLDSHRVVWFDMLRRPESGFTVAFDYDDESRPPLRASSEVFRLVIERRFY
jgi:hypothetical protein